MTATSDKDINIDDRQLAEALVSHGLIEADKIKQLQQKQKQNYRQAKQVLDGILFEIDPIQNLLRIKDTRDDHIKQTFPLNESEQEFDDHDWEAWGSHATVVKTEDGTYETHLEWDNSQPYGLVLTPEGTYTSNVNTYSNDVIGLSHSFLYGCNFKGELESGPFDLYLSPDNTLLSVTDRGAGTVTIFKADTYEKLGSVTVRGETGSHATLNTAFDLKRQRLLITDNKTSALHMIDLNTLKTHKQSLGLGVLGNLVLAPDQKHFYILTIKPNLSLKYLSLDTFDEIKTIKLKGDLYSADSSDPCDLLILSPNQSQLLIMTYLNEPRPFTPVISVIDTEQIKTVRRYAIKDQKKPINLIFGKENPVSPFTKDLTQLLIEEQALEPQKIFQVKQELRTAGFDEESDESSTQSKPQAEEFIEIERQVIDIETIEEKPEQKVETMEPQEAADIKLNPADAIPEIVDIITGTFYHQTEIDIEDYPEALTRVQTAAEETRKKLETHDSAIVDLKNLVESHHLITQVLREAIVTMIDLKSSLKEGMIRTAPTHCPNCRAPLLGSWNCDMCGLELESPERMLKRKVASAEPIANLSRGYFVIPDPERKRLVLLNQHKHISWKLEPPKFKCDQPTDIVWLANRNILVVDKKGCQVLECGPVGRTRWTVNQATSPAHQLHEPVKATYYNHNDKEYFLVVDQGNHRVFAIDREQEIHWQYGVQGIPGSDSGQLNSPSDVQKTHEGNMLITDTGNNRIVELDENDDIKWEYGSGEEDEELNHPVSAQRLFNDQTMIVDAGNFRILVLNKEKQLIWSCQYYQSDMDMKFKIDHPIKVIRRENKNILIMDEFRILEIQPENKQLVWFSLLRDLKKQPVFERNQKVESPKRQRGVKSYKKYDYSKYRKEDAAAPKVRGETPPVQEEAAVGEGGAKRDMSAMAANRLKALIAARKKREAKASSRMGGSVAVHQPLDPEIFKAENVSIQNILIYCIDRQHNHVVQLDRNGKIRWHYGTPQPLVRPQLATETEKTVLITDTGSNRVLEINKADKRVIMEIGGRGSELLFQPRSAMRIHLGYTLICDQGNKRLIQVDAKGNITWEFKDSQHIFSPYHAEQLETGNILYVDSRLHVVNEINREGLLSWSYGTPKKFGKDKNQLFGPEFATRLPNGNTLIADTRNNRILEIDPGRNIVWEYTGDIRNRLRGPVRCQRLSDGNTLITHYNQRQIVEVNPKGDIVWRFQMGRDPLVKIEEHKITSAHIKQGGPTLSTHDFQFEYSGIEQKIIKASQLGGDKLQEIHIELEKTCAMKSVRASLIMMRLDGVGNVIKTHPGADLLQAERFDTDFHIAILTAINPDELKKMVTSVAEVADVQIKSNKI